MTNSNLIRAALVMTAASWLSPVAAADTSVKQPWPEGSPPRGVVVTPDSSIAKPEDAGTRMHTNTKIFVPLPSAPNMHPGESGSRDKSPEPAPPAAAGTRQ